MEMQIITQEEITQSLPVLMRNVPTANSLLTACAVYCAEQNLKSEIDCFHSKSKTFGFIEHSYPKSGLALLVVLVGELADSFNIGKNLSAPQMVDTAQMILNEYPELKIDDVALCFSKAKKGHYGKVYDRLDSAIIFGWLEMFLADKNEQIEYFWKHQQTAIKKDDQPLLPPIAAAPDDVALRYLKEIKKDVFQISRKNNQARRILTPAPVKENLIYEFHQHLIQRFNELYEIEIWGETKHPRGTRFITCCGKKLDIAEYIQKKHTQLALLADKINLRWDI
jgi:hypothetical protein